MKKSVYYIENSTTLQGVLATLEDIIPCFITREPIEMGWLEVSITARQEDLPTVEKYLAPLV